MIFFAAMTEQKNAAVTAEQRRRDIVELLFSSGGPISASALAARFSVSRQIIVGDIALLRASGIDISATPRGYVSSRSRSGLIRTVACVHDMELLLDELNIMVDNGCTVLDVIVEHPVYGQISGRLELSSRYDVMQFCEKLQTEAAPPLSSLTGGVHLHTLLCPDDDAYRRVCAQLRERGIIFSQQVQNSDQGLTN